MNTLSVMNLTSIQDSLTLTLNTFYVSLLSFFPKVFAAVLIFIIGVALSHWIKTLVVKTLEKMRLSTSLEKTPIGAFLKNAEVTTKIEVIAASVVYWLLILLVLNASVSVLGLSAVSTVLNRILFYIPKVLSAVLILVFGTLLAGIAEAVVKGAVKSIDGKSSRMLGTVTSYLIMVIAVLAGVSELGIAQQFINTLFMGVVAAIALATGLAFGLGSKDTVNTMMSEWYAKFRQDKKN